MAASGEALKGDSRWYTSVSLSDTDIDPTLSVSDVSGSFDNGVGSCRDATNDNTSGRRN